MRQTLVSRSNLFTGGATRLAGCFERALSGYPTSNEVFINIFPGSEKNRVDPEGCQVQDCRKGTRALRPGVCPKGQIGPAFVPKGQKVQKPGVLTPGPPMGSSRPEGASDSELHITSKYCVVIICLNHVLHCKPGKSPSQDDIPGRVPIIAGRTLALLSMSAMWGTNPPESDVLSGGSLLGRCFYPGLKPIGVKISDAQLTSAVRCRRTISVC